MFGYLAIDMRIAYHGENHNLSTPVSDAEIHVNSDEGKGCGDEKELYKMGPELEARLKEAHYLHGCF